MATFYKGAGVGTHWHINDSREVGFEAWSPTTNPTIEALITHVTKSTTNSPYISLTRSYAVAWNYAVRGGTNIRTLDKPGYVYEIEIDTPLPLGLKLLDPVKEVAMSLPNAIDVDSEGGYPFYQHNGLPHFLLGVVGLGDMSKFRVGRQPQPPGPGVPCPPNLTPQLEALVNALRDAEILLHGRISPSCVKNRFEVKFTELDEEELQ
jgi:hypothetical protein